MDYTSIINLIMCISCYSKYASRANTAAPLSTVHCVLVATLLLIGRVLMLYSRCQEKMMKQSSYTLWASGAASCFLKFCRGVFPEVAFCCVGFRVFCLFFCGWCQKLYEHKICLSVVGGSSWGFCSSCSGNSRYPCRAEGSAPWKPFLLPQCSRCGHTAASRLLVAVHNMPTACNLQGE